MNNKYQPNERQHNCRYGFCYMGKNYDKTCCKRKHVISEEDGKEHWKSVTNTECDMCQDYDSRFIEYPITVNGINFSEFNQYDMCRSGSLVRIAPCAKEYEGKTFIGMYLGELPYMQSVSYDKKSQNLDVKAIHNAAIYVFELKKIIFGMASYWQIIDSIDDFQELTKEDIDNVWYVKLMKDMMNKS